jgi:hypothetical protein
VVAVSPAKFHDEATAPGAQAAPTGTAVGAFF